MAIFMSVPIYSQGSGKILAYIASININANKLIIGWHFIAELIILSRKS